MIPCRECRQDVGNEDTVCPQCGTPVPREAAIRSPFVRPSIPSRSNRAHTGLPRTLAARPAIHSAAFVYGLAAVSALLLVAVVGHVLLTRANHAPVVSTSTPVVVSSPEPDVRAIPQKPWAIRLYSFEEVGAVRLPRVYAGVVRDFPSFTECEASIHSALPVTAQRAAAKLPPGGGWGWRDEAIVRPRERLAVVWDGDRHWTYFGAWCVEE